MEIYSLPKYRRCDCHTLNLVDHDPRNIKDRHFVKLYGSLESKLKSFWKKQASSAKASVLIKETLERLFVLPNETRYDLHSFNCSFTIYLIYSLHFKGGTFFFMPWKEWRLLLKKPDSALRKIFPRNLTFQLYERQRKYLKIYTPVTEALDILQGDKNVCAGFLLLPLHILKFRWNSFRLYRTYNYAIQ